MMANMKLVAQVKLLPSPEQAAGMKATLRACNDAANWVSTVAFGMTSRRNYDVRKRAYKEIRSRYRDGKWFLAVTIDVPDPDLCEPVGWLGVDLGIVNIATISDGERMTGRRLTRKRGPAGHTAVAGGGAVGWRAGLG